MKDFLKIFFDAGAQGSISYGDGPASNAAGVLNAANDGLSTDAATSKIAQLGQTLGRAGNPAILLENREIPFGGNTLAFGINNGIANVIVFDPNNGMDFSNNTGFWMLLTILGHNYQFFSPSTGIFDFNFGPETLEYDLATLNGDLSFTNRFGSRGFKQPLRPLVFADSPITVVKTDYTLLIDSTGGNIVVNLNPATLFDATNNLGQIVNIKKISADANTITLTATSGLIIDTPPGAGTFVILTPGDNIQIQSDGTNLYVL